MEILRASSYWRDLQGIIDYFVDGNAEHAAANFLDALDETVEFLEEFPDLGSPWESTNARHAGLRFSLVKGFESCLVLYRRDGQRLFLLRVVHGSLEIKGQLN